MHHQLCTGLDDLAGQTLLSFLLFKPPCRQLKANGQAAFSEERAVSQQSRGENTSIHQLRVRDGILETRDDSRTEEKELSLQK